MIEWWGMETTPALPHSFILRNRIPAAGWVFISLFLALTAAFTWLLVRDGPPPSQPAWMIKGALALFWVAGIGAASHLWSIPCTSVTRAPDGSLTFASRTPLRRRVERIPRPAIAGVEVVRTRDGDGDPYWQTELVLADGTRRLLREGHDQTAQETIARALRATLRLP